MLMKILFDHQIFDLQQYGGISRYFCELMSHYAAVQEPEFELACPFTSNAYLWGAPFLKLNTPLTRKRFKGSGLINNLLAGRKNRSAAEIALRAKDFDLFHPTYYDPYFLPLLGDKPFVLTVHDMIHERYPEGFPLEDMTADWKKMLVQCAAHIIAVSDSTKADLIDYCHVSADKISVIQHGCSFGHFSAKDSSSDSLKQSLLFVGDRSRYKNFTFAVLALAPLFKKYPALELLCVGGGDFTKEEQSLFAALKVINRCRQVKFDDDALAAAYSSSAALIFPSRCEGFGIPVLEAFACGCPVLLSSSTSLPEVGGDAALYFDPYNGAELFYQADRLLTDNFLRDKLVMAGRARVREFIWERTAAETQAVYSKVLRERH